MNRVIESEYCILGNGYASNIASFLLRQKAKEVVVVGDETNGDVYKIALSSGSVSPLPVFPDQCSDLYARLDLGAFPSVPKVEVGYSDLIDFRLEDFEILEGSLADFFSSSRLPLESFVLGLKQWGSLVFTNPLSEVRRKIARNYMSKRRSQRVGYLNGFDLYYHFCSSRVIPGRLVSGAIGRIDYKNKILHSAGTEIRYKKLVSTVPIMRLLECCGFERTSNFACHPSHFVYFSHASVFPPGQVIYDCDLGSDVFRVFSISDNIIAAQLACHRRENASVERVKKRIAEIVPSITGLVFERRLFVPVSYPTESISDPGVLDDIKTLKGHDILPFGRFGSWQYVDLHELDWESLCW
jgi:hypothetical protein